MALQKQKRNGNGAHRHSPAQLTRLHELYEYMQSLPDKEFDKALEQLGFEDATALAAYTTAQNAKKGVRLS